MVHALTDKIKKPVKKNSTPANKTSTGKKKSTVKKAAKQAAFLEITPSQIELPAAPAPGTPNIIEKPRLKDDSGIDLLAPIKKKMDKAERILTKASDFIEQKDIAEKNEEPEDLEAQSRGDVPMGVIDHLDEIRGRLLTILAMLIVFTGVGFFFSDDLLRVINRPFVESGQKLHIFTLAGGFMLKLKAAFGCGVVIGFPFIVFQVWRFIAPAISITSRIFIRVTLLAAIFLFYLGIAFVYFLLLPVAIKVLLDFIGNDMTSAIGAESYLSFIIIFSVGMGLLFEFPVVVMLLTKMGVVTPLFLTKYRKHAIVVIWIISAVITPTPDPINLSIVAVCLMAFYEISILVSKWIYRGRIKKMTA